MNARAAAAVDAAADFVAAAGFVDVDIAAAADVVGIPLALDDRYILPLFRAERNY
jgi:hypothetical protein